MRPKKRELHELPYLEMAKSVTSRLAYEEILNCPASLLKLNLEINFLHSIH